jgi:hypothetical protein
MWKVILIIENIKSYLANLKASLNTYGHMSFEISMIKLIFRKKKLHPKGVGLKVYTLTLKP